MFRHKYYDAISGKRKEKKKSGFKTEKAAIQALVEVKAQTLRGETKILDNDHLTVGEWLDTWVEMNKTNWKPSTLKQRELAVKNHFKRLIGHLKLQQLDRATYQRAFINQIKNDVGASTVLLYHSIFKVAINAAVEEEILDRNRFKKIIIKDENNEDFKKTTNNFISPQELNAVLAIAKEFENTTNFNILQLVAYTGVRRGECLGLQWNDIDFKNNTISIKRTRDNYGARTPKTKNSYRTIKIEPFVMKDLESYQKWCKKVMLTQGKKLASEDFVFINEYGELIGGYVVDRMFKHNMLKAGILNNQGEAKITFHGLRHTHATILLNGGMNVKVIADRLGNTPEMVYKIYGHVLEELEYQSVNVFSESLKQNIGATSGANH